MKNPWTKKNPWMSMWLSGANAVIGSARGHAAAATKREAKSLVAQGTKEAANFWVSLLTPGHPSKTKRRRNKR